jgi:release factor glutamine methyltransferase
VNNLVDHFADRRRAKVNFGETSGPILQERYGAYYGSSREQTKVTMGRSIAEAILEATSILRRAGLTEPRREAGSLLAHVLDQDRTFLITHAADALSTEENEVLRQYVARRAAGEPLQYITGSQDFFGLNFAVSRDALIPRPETELLIEVALALMGDRDSSTLICDIGTGTGCIATTLLHERPLVRGVAVDISPAAVELAFRNATNHGVNERLSFLIADGLNAFAAGPHFDLIVSNPPYIPDEDLAGLQREVREHEPRVALTSGADGLSMIRYLLQDAADYLVPGGHLIIEIGFGQKTAVEALIDPEIWQLVSISNDLQGIPRTIALQKRL